MMSLLFTNTSKREPRSYPWVVVGLLWGVALLNYMDRQMLSTMKPAMQIDIPELRSATHFGYLMSIFLWIYAIMSPVSGVIADRMNRKWLIIFSLLVWSAVTFAMGYAKSFHEVYWLRAIMGVSEAMYIPAALSLIADYHSSRTRSFAIGLHMTGLYIGQALGGFGATVAARFSWQTTFHDFGFVGIIYALMLILCLRERPDRNGAWNHKGYESKQGLAPNLRSLVSNPAFWVILFVFAIPSLPGWAAKNWLPTLFAQNLNITMAAAGPLSTITTALSSLAGVIGGGVLSDRWVQHHIRARVYISAIGLSLTIPALLLLGFGHTLLTVTGAAVCFGLGYGMFDANNMPLLCQFVSPGARAAGYGLMNMTGVLCGAMITGMLGKSSDAGHLGNSFAMLAAVVLLTLILQLLFLKPKIKENV